MRDSLENRIAFMGAAHVQARHSDSVVACHDAPVAKLNSLLRPSWTTNKKARTVTKTAPASLRDFGGGGGGDETPQTNSSKIIDASQYPTTILQ